MDEKELIKRALTDRSAFNEIVSLHYKEVFNYIYKRTLDRELSKDLTQETFLRALKYLHSFKGKTPFIFYLLRIATNLINDHFKNEKRLRNIKDKHLNFVSAKRDVQSDSYDYSFVFDCLKKLPEIQQTVITLVYFEDKSIKEAAIIMRKSYAVTRIALHRALNNLKKEIKKNIKNF